MSQRTNRSTAGLAALVLAASAIALPALAAAAAVSAGTAPEKAGVAWLDASSDIEIDAAFARARSERKPLFLYWGATWCPPCNQVKATLFNRQEFIARSRSFIAVYVDGDKPGAQQLGARFKVRGYPTMVLFDADANELTRLPGEIGASQYTEVLGLGIAARRPLRAVLADATDAARSTGVSAAEWRMLAFYAWPTDERQLVAKAAVPALLSQLATNCPRRFADTADRLLLQALAAGSAPLAADPATTRRVADLLADAPRAREQMDLLTNHAAALVSALSAADSAERRRLIGQFDRTLQRLAIEPTLSRADRLTAQIARVELARQLAPQLPATLLDSLRAQVARDDREIKDGYERQAVITTAAQLLSQAGLVAESDRLLKANLPRSHSPYYLMSALGSNARLRGDSADALHWYAQAHARSVGSATRLQWGASHLNALVDLAPADAGAIEAVASQIFDEAGASADAFYERSARSLQRISAKLQGWAAAADDQRQARATLDRLQIRLETICSTLKGDAQARGVCNGLLKPAAAGVPG